MKRFLSLLLAMAMVLGVMVSAPFTPVAYATNNVFNYTLNANNEATITGYTGDAVDVVIPDTIDGYTVIAIGSSAFNNCTSLVSVEIPSTVKTISNAAFYCCKNIVSLTIPEGVTSIGNSAFYYCKSLTTLEIPDSVTSIGTKAFYLCNGLTQVSVGAGVQSISDSAFSGCAKLEEIKLSANITSIDASAFADCSALKHTFFGGTQEQWYELNIGANNTCLTDSAIHYEATGHVANGSWSYVDFDCSVGGERYQLCLYCDEHVIHETLPAQHIIGIDGNCISCGIDIYDFSIENGYAYIEKYHGTEAIVVVPNTLGGYPVGVIGDEAFMHNPYIKSVTLPDTVVRIDGNSFASSETAILRLPNNDITIDLNSFSSFGLSYVEFGAGQVTFSDMPASNYFCQDLSIYIPKEHDIKRFMMYLDNCFNNDIYIAQNLTIFCELTEVEYLSVTGRQSAELQHGEIIFATKPVVGEYGDFLYKENQNGTVDVFAYTGNQTSVTVPSEINGKPVTGIGTAFFNHMCYVDGIATHKNSIEEIILPESLQRIEDGAFFCCESLAKINIPEGVKFVGLEAFAATALEAAYEESGEVSYYIDNCLISGTVDEATGKLQVKDGTTVIAMDAIPADCAALVLPASLKAVSDSAFLQSEELSYIFYQGTQEQWAQLYVGEGNGVLNTAAIHYGATDHTISEWVSESVQDCETDGVEKAYCTACEHEVTRTFPAKGHSYVNDVCTKCGGEYEEFRLLPILGTGVLESSHPYGNNINQTKTYSCSGASYIKVTFSTDTYVENSYDTIYITDGYGEAYSNTSTGNTYFTGAELADKEIIINDDTVNIRLTTDHSVQEYGYYATCVAYSGNSCDGKHIHTRLINVTEEDCYSDGYTGDVVCAVCEDVLEEGEVIPSEHNYVNNICTECSGTCFEYSVYDGEIVITAFVGSGEIITIPSVIAGYPVTKIDAYAFQGADVKKIIMSDGVKEIRSDAFYGCEKLQEVILPDTLEHIGYDAFENTALYENESNWEDGCLYIGKYLIAVSEDFSGKLYIKEGTTLIAENDLLNLRVTGIHLPASYVLQENFIEAVSSLYNEEYTVDEANPYLSAEDGVLFNKDKTRLIYYPAGKTDSFYAIPDTVKEIGYGAFVYSARLKNINIPESVEKIESYAFFFSGIHSLEIPDSVTYIGEEAIYCFNLRYLKLGPNIAHIEDYGIYMYAGVLELPELSADVFEEGSIFGGAVQVHYAGAEEAFEVLLENEFIQFELPVNNEDEFYQNDVFFESENVIKRSPEYLYMLNSQGEAVLVDYIGNATELVVPTQIDGIAVASTLYAYYDYNSVVCVYDLFDDSVLAAEISSKIKKVTIPDSMVSQEFLFMGCMNLEEVVLPAGIKQIPVNAFAYCINLKTFQIPSSVEEISHGAFENSGLTSITIPDSVKTIGDYAFASCDNLTAVEMQDGVESIGSRVFYYCSNLTSITIPDSVTKIGSCIVEETPYYYNESNWEDGSLYVGKHLLYAYDYSHDTITIKDGTLTVADEAIFDANEINVPASVKYFGSGNRSNYGINVNEANQHYCSVGGVLFNKGKTELIAYPCALDTAEYTIPESVEYIGAKAFEYCSELTTLVIPESVQAIGEDAFYQCYNIKYIFYGGTEAQWNEIKADYGNSDLTEAPVHFESSGHTMSDEWICGEDFDCESGYSNILTKNCTVCGLVMEHKRCLRVTLQQTATANTVTSACIHLRYRATMQLLQATQGTKRFLKSLQKLMATQW